MVVMEIVMVVPVLAVVQQLLDCLQRVRTVLEKVVGLVELELELQLIQQLFLLNQLDQDKPEHPDQVVH